MSKRTMSQRTLMHVAMAAGCACWTSAYPLTAQDVAVDRTKPPVVPAAKPPTLPSPTIVSLQNGITVAVLEDHHVPLVSVRAVMYIPAALEPYDKIGLTEIVRQMLQEGTTSHTPEQLADAFAALGDTVSPFGFYSTTANLDQSLDLMAEQLMHPAFPAAALERLKTNTLERLRQGQQDAEYLANRLFVNIIYGRDHSYAREGAVHVEELTAITREDVADYYKQYFCPPNVMFVVAGDVTPDEATKKLERVFGTWALGNKAAASIQLPSGSASATVYLFDRPHSPESVIMFGDVGLRWGSDAYPALLLNTVFGGTLSSRLEANLRDEHHYTDSVGSHYILRAHPNGAPGGGGAQSQVAEAPSGGGTPSGGAPGGGAPSAAPQFHLPSAPPVGPQAGTFMITMRVPTEKTDSAVNEVLNEMRDLRSERPPTPEELDFAKSAMTMHTTLQFETLEQRANEVATLLKEEIPYWYYRDYKAVVNRFKVTPDKVEHATKYIDPFAIGIIVVGDRSVLEPKFRAADIAPVVLLDQTGGIGAN